MHASIIQQLIKIIFFTTIGLPIGLKSFAQETIRFYMELDDLAKMITQNGYVINRNELFTWMVHNGYLLKRSRRIGGKRINDYSPLQEGARLRLFHLHAEHIKGLNCMRYTCKVTGKGQIYFVNKFREILNNEYRSQ